MDAVAVGDVVQNKPLASVAVAEEVRSGEDQLHKQSALCCQVKATHEGGEAAITKPVDYGRARRQAGQAGRIRRPHEIEPLQEGIPAHGVCTHPCRVGEDLIEARFVEPGERRATTFNHTSNEEPPAGAIIPYEGRPI